MEQYPTPPGITDTDIVFQTGNRRIGLFSAYGAIKFLIGLVIFYIIAIILLLFGGASVWWFLGLTAICLGIGYLTWRNDLAPQRIDRRGIAF